MIESDFKNAMHKAGVLIKDPVVADGKLHRFHIDGDKRNSKNGWYVLFGDELPAGSYGNWKTCEQYTWCARSPSELTLAQRTMHMKRMEEARKLRELEEKVTRQNAQQKANEIWESASIAPNNHPYLSKKGVKNYGLKFNDGGLIVPLRDSAGALMSLQFINGQGQKRFLFGGRKKGCCFTIGKPSNKLCIAEGYATAASIHEATGYPIAISFDAGNLLPVAKSLRAKFPDLELVICADNDSDKEKNVGLSKAKEAALAVGALLSVAGVTYG